MTHRVDLELDGQVVTISFQGRLDSEALSALTAQCRAEQRRGRDVRLCLDTGSEVSTAILEELIKLDNIGIEATSPFLARWIERCRKTAKPNNEEPQS